MSFQFFKVCLDFVKMKFDIATHDRARDHDCSCRILFSALHVQKSRSHVTPLACDGPRLSQAIALWASTVTFAIEYLPSMMANLRSRWEMGYGQFGVGHRQFPQKGRQKSMPLGSALCRPWQEDSSDPFTVCTIPWETIWQIPVLMRFGVIGDLDNSCTVG